MKTLREQLLENEATLSLYENKQGFYLELKEGFTWFGLSVLHEKSFTRLFCNFKNVKKCNE